MSLDETGEHLAAVCWTARAGGGVSHDRHKVAINHSDCSLAKQSLGRKTREY